MFFFRKYKAYKGWCTSHTLIRAHHKSSNKNSPIDYYLLREILIFLITITLLFLNNRKHDIFDIDFLNILDYKLNMDKVKYFCKRMQFC